MFKPTVLLLSMLLSLSCFSNNGSNQKLVTKNVVFGDSLSAATIPSPAVLLNEIVLASGLQLHFDLRAADVDNLEAGIRNKKRFILYNPAFIEQINEITRSKWATATLLAHEVGHHLNGHTLKKRGSHKKIELEADEFAGFILKKMGATLQEAQEVMKYIASATDSKTHPNRNARMLAIEKGWNR